MKILYLLQSKELKSMLSQLEDNFTEQGIALYDEIANEIDRRIQFDTRKAV